MATPPENKKPRLLNDTPSLYDTTNTNPTLLYIPFNDFPKSETTKTTPIHNSQDDNDDGDDDHDNEQLLLIQLPAKGLTIQDLLKPSPSAENPAVCIVGGSKDDTSPSACLVVETTGQSYALNRVETSNSLIVVPQYLKSTSKSDGKGGNIAARYARLLANPSPSFLELKPRGLNRQHLWDILSKHVYNPYEMEIDGDDTNDNADSSLAGKSMGELALELQSSNMQVLQALQNIHAYKRTQNKKPDLYCILDEEVEMNATQAILSAIIEADDEKLLSSTSSTQSSELEKEGILVLEQKTIVEEAMKNMLDQSNEKISWSKDVIQHCLQGLSTSQKQTQDETLIHLDIKKIALFLAHQLFNSRSTPWPIDDFVNEWHRGMPGVGKSFEPSIDILGGVALHHESSSHMSDLSSSVFTNNPSSMTRIKSEKGNTKEEIIKSLKYFPERKLPLDPKSRFQSLFREKEQWLSQELDPYMERLVGDESGTTKAELLLKYTCMVEDEEGVTWYRSR